MSALPPKADIRGRERNGLTYHVEPWKLLKND
jgi:hypothetical protein